MQKELSQRDIAVTIEDIYGFDISHDTISIITDSVLLQLEEWQSRPLQRVYPFVFIDCLSTCKELRPQKNAVYTVLAYHIEGKRDILGLWISEP